MAHTSPRPRLPLGRRGLVFVGLLALIAPGLACSSDDDSASSGSTSITSTTKGRPTTTSVTSPASSPPTPTTAPGPTTAPPTSGPPTSSPPTSGPTGDDPSVRAGQTVNRIWFLHGERLTAGYRTGTTARAALRDLLEGSTRADGADVVTAIPTGTTLRSLRVEGGIATVDLSGGFGSGGGSLSMMARLAQLVFTATEFPAIEAVSILLDGVPVEALGGEGIDVSTPLGREHFDGLKPLIMVQSPLPGQELSSPFLVTGENSTFENTVRISLAAEDGTELVSTFTTGTGSIIDRDGNRVWGPYEASIAHPTSTAMAGTLTVFSPSPEGDRRNEAEMSIPVRLTGTSAPGLPGGASTEAQIDAGHAGWARDRRAAGRRPNRSTSGLRTGRVRVREQHRPRLHRPLRRRPRSS